MCKLVIFPVVVDNGEEKTLFVRNRLSATKIQIFPLAEVIKSPGELAAIDWQNELYAILCKRLWGKKIAKKVDFKRVSVILGCYNNGTAATLQNQKCYIAVKFSLPVLLQEVPPCTLRGQELVAMSNDEAAWMLRVKLNHANEIEDAQVLLEAVHEVLIKIVINFEVFKNFYHPDFSGDIFYCAVRTP